MYGLKPHKTLTVGELIKELERYTPATPVYVLTDSRKLRELKAVELHIFRDRLFIKQGKLVRALDLNKMG